MGRYIGQTFVCREGAPAGWAVSGRWGPGHRRPGAQPPYRETAANRYDARTLRRRGGADDRSQAMTPFVVLNDAGSPGRFTLPLVPGVCVGAPDQRHMFGGVGLAAAISAMERACGRPAVWATAHFITPAPLGRDVEIQVDVLNEGRHTTQASVVGRIGDAVAFQALGALGSRASEISQQWRDAPDVPPPEDCPVARHWRGGTEDVHSRLEVRVAKGRYGQDRIGAAEPDGRLLIWVRPREGARIDAATLAVIGDLLPTGVGNALGQNAGGNSLDNTLRVLRILPTEWVLAEVLIQGVESGFAHGAARLFAQGGELLAVASQSLILRLR